MPQETFPHFILEAKDQRLGVGQDQLPCWSTRTSSGHCQETEACMVQTCHTPRQPLQNHPSAHLGGWAPPWSAEEMLDGQHQRVDIHARARTTHNGLLQKKTKTTTTTGGGSLLNPPLCSPYFGHQGQSSGERDVN